MTFNLAKLLKRLNIVCTRWAESSKTFNNSWIQLHKILKFGSFVVLLDPLKIFQNLFVQMLYTIFTANQKFPHFLWEALEMHASLQPLPELILDSNHTCLLLIPILSSLVTWLAKKLFVSRKNSLLIFYYFSGFSSTIVYVAPSNLIKCFNTWLTALLGWLHY